MITPTFSCSQDGKFVIIVVCMSAICKVMDAVFDISGNQFTFYCKPYYLRLRFNQLIREGCGERATYDLESHRLTVYLPKAIPDEIFDNLDNPQYLLATEKQRELINRLVTEIHSESDQKDVDEETEFVQTLQGDQTSEQLLGNSEQSCELAKYGFGLAFSGLFKRLDADLISEIVDVPSPDITMPNERRLVRLTKENADFCFDAVIDSVEDTDGDIQRLLSFVPPHIKDFKQALIADQILYVKVPPTSTLCTEAFEQEEEKEFSGEKIGEVWHGNVMDFKKPLIMELPCGQEQQSDEIAARWATQSQPQNLPLSESRGTSDSAVLAIPRQKPVLEFSKEETHALIKTKMPALFFPPSKAHVVALTCDLLFSEAYDELFSEGGGCCESVWNLCILSPSLSFLDSPESLYESCFYFARRMFTYPLYRHPALLSRVFATVGTRMLLGTRYVVRALLRIRSVLSHSEHKHVLCTIFLDPLIAYWMNAADGDNTLVQAALELHEHATRKSTIIVRAVKKPVSLLPQAELLKSRNKTAVIQLRPLTLENLDLPLSEAEEGEVY